MSQTAPEETIKASSEADRQRVANSRYSRLPVGATVLCEIRFRTLQRLPSPQEFVLIRVSSSASFDLRLRDHFLPAASLDIGVPFKKTLPLLWPNPKKMC